MQARNKVLPMVLDSAESVDYRENRFVVQGRSDEYVARMVIVATGVKPKRLFVPGIGDQNDGLFHTWRELPEIRGKRVAIIGGGEAAFDQACSLAERGANVIVLIRGHAARAFHGLVQEAQALGVDVRVPCEHLPGCARRGSPCASAVRSCSEHAPRQLHPGFGGGCSF